jgi:peptidoglycan-N-acetylglucosamine deacetylase
VCLRSPLLLASLLFAPVARGQQIAFTFDDLPSHGPLPQGETRLQIAQSILDTLKNDHMPPTYGFVNGVHLTTDPSTADVLKAWTAAGQPLGNHTYSHPNLAGMTAEAFEQEIEKNEPILKQYAGDSDWHWLRFPFLSEGETLDKRHAVRTWLTAHNYKIAEVNMSFGDYLWNPPYARCVAKHDEAGIKQLHSLYLAAADDAIVPTRALAKEVYGRDIPYVLLMHIGAFDAHMLPDLIALYRSRGFTFVSLPQAEKDPAYSDDADIAPGNGTELDQLAIKRKLPIPPQHNYSKELDSICQ